MTQRRLLWTAAAAAATLQSLIVVVGANHCTPSLPASSSSSLGIHSPLAAFSSAPQSRRLRHRKHPTPTHDNAQKTQFRRPSREACRPSSKASSWNVLSSKNNNGGEGVDPGGANGGPSDASSSKNGKNSVARAGGRRPKIDPRSRNRDAVTKNTDESTDGGGGILSTVRRWTLPLCLLAVALKFMLGTIFGGGGGGSPNVVYYSSSVYQSTSYARDGSVETVRKEDYRSNVPGWVERSREEQQQRRVQQNNNGRAGYRDGYDFDLVDEEVTMDDEIIDSMMLNQW